MKASLDEIWADAAKQFQDICGESLQRGDIKSFDDVRKKIENVDKQANGDVAEKEEKWDQAKSIGLQTLKYMKLLLGAASQASTFIPVPTAAANIAGSALSFVFDIPEKIHSYNKAVDSVFTEVSTALAQFQIYESMGSMDPSLQTLLAERIHLVMVSIVKICAHVVKYRQGRKRDRFKKQVASILDNNTPLSAEMDEFNKLLEAQRGVEGTVALSVLVETHSGVVQLLESFAVFSKAAEETTQGVQALKDDNDRTKTLKKIRDTLQVPSIVHLDTRSTQTCTDIAIKCLPGTASWLWTHSAFTSWTEGDMKYSGRECSNMLLVSGPPSSGKTMVTTQIVKRLEEERGRTYVAHYFFMPNSNKKANEDNKSPVHSALRYMAFQIARVDAALRKSLGKVCDSESASALSRTASLETLWSELKIGVSASGATYYLVLDGIENLDEKERDMLLKFLFNGNLAQDFAGRRVRFLASATDNVLDDFDLPVLRNALRIRVEQHNAPDMRLYIESALNKQGPLRHAKSGSVQQKARDNIVMKLPQKSSGSYSQLQFALDEVVRLLSSRTSFKELDKMLDLPMNSHETAIKALQRSLTLEEIGELNELLRWVHFGQERMTVDELEAAMLLYSGTESIGLLIDVISSKYQAVLKIDNTPDGAFVDGQDGALEFLQKETGHKAKHAKDHPTISMTININNVDQEVVQHFLWDLAQKAIRDQFRFDSDAGSNTLHTSHSTIAVDEFEAHHSIVMRSFTFLSEEPREATAIIGRYLFLWLPYHLGQLIQLDYADKGSLMPDEYLKIGQNLYHLFKDQETLKRHRATAEEVCWSVEDIEIVQQWLRNTAVVRRLPMQWREEIQAAASPVRGYLKPFVKMIINSWLKDAERKSLSSMLAYRLWIMRFMEVDEKSQATLQMPRLNANTPDPPTPATSETPQVDWDHVSSWCQNLLDLPDSEIDSLWWMRIAMAAMDAFTGNEEVVSSLFQRALDKENSSFLCNANLAQCYYNMGRIPEAIVEMELALQKAEKDPVALAHQDALWIHEKLAELNLDNKDYERAAKEYAILSESSDPEWAEKGHVGYTQARLESNDVQQARVMLLDFLSKEDNKGSMVHVLKMIARDDRHDFLITKMFNIAKDDPVIWKGLVAAMENATTPAPPDEDDASETLDDGHFAESESRGVLLYHRGMMVAYRHASVGAYSAENALPFWHQCRDQLSTVGGYVASTTRANATKELAKFYFESILSSKSPAEYAEALNKLAEDDFSVEGGYAVGYLAALHSLRGEQEKAKALLSQRMKTALQILSDDQPDNDYYGFIVLFKALASCNDLDNATVAMSFLGESDAVTGALRDQPYEVMVDVRESDQGRVLELAKELGKQVIKAVIGQVPDPALQAQRVIVAKEHVDALVGAAAAAAAATTEETTADSEPARTAAIALLRGRISDLEKVDLSDYYRRWSCDGRSPEGTECGRFTDSTTEFYHCIHCANQDFCPSCYKALRAGTGTNCSASHAWIRIPQERSQFFCSLESKTVRLPKVTSVEGDKRLWEVVFDEDAPELTLTDWIDGLARAWTITLADG